MCIGIGRIVAGGVLILMRIKHYTIAVRTAVTRPFATHVVARRVADTTG
jgi:hypothetical protein